MMMNLPPAPSTPPASSPAAPPPDGHAPPPRTGRDVLRFPRTLLVLTALFLEALPVSVLLAAGNQGGPAPQPPAFSFWGILGVLTLAYLVAALGQRIVGEQELSGPLARGIELRPLSFTQRVVPGLVVLIGYAVTIVLALLLSPVAYGGLSPAAALSAFEYDVTTSLGHLGAFFGLSALLAYFWWRGLTLGRHSLSGSVMTRRFLIGLGAIILAIIVVAANPGPATGGLQTMLALALPFEVFCGLFGSALGRAFDAEEERQRRRGQGGTDAAQGFSRSWLLTTLGISGGMVVLALIASLFVTLRGLSALFALLAPIGDALTTVLEWIAYAIAFVLYFVLSGLLAHIGQNLSTHTSTTSTSPVQPPKTHVSTNLPASWVTATQWLLLALVVVVLAVVLVRLLRYFARVNRAQSFEEERTSLDGRALLLQQLRDLFRRSPREVVSEEALAPGSVRALYRDLLRAAARAGYPRRASETPQEYARRLAALAGTDLPAPALDALTGAYYATRYGARSDASMDEASGTVAAPAATVEATEASPEVRAAFAEVTRWLAAHPASDGDEGASRAGQLGRRGRRSSRG